MCQVYNVQTKDILRPNESLTVYEPGILKFRRPIVAIHGMWATGQRWSHYGRFFSERGFRFLAPTLRLHYPENNIAELGRTSVNDYVKDIVELIQNLTEKTGLPDIGKLQKPIVFGHSMGGLIAQKLASLGLAEKLVLINSAPPSGIKLHADLLYQLNALRYLLEMIFEKPFKPSFGLYARYILNGVPKNQRKMFYEAAVYESGRVAKEIRFGKIQVDFSKITCPTLIIACEKDRITPPQIAFDIRKAIRRSNPKSYPILSLFPRFAHLVLVEPDWETPATKILQWLRKSEFPDQI